MTHPLLKDPENARAYAQLQAESNGSVRTWAKSLGWSQGKLQRFLKAVSKAGLGTIEVQYRGRGSLFKPIGPPVSGCIVSHRIGNQVLDSGLTTKSRFGGSPVELQEGAAELVALMNQILCKKHPMSFLPVNPAGPVSHAAARVWLVEFGIPFPDAVEILTDRCLTFNPSKINGDMPRSLGFFTKSVKARWQKMQNRRQQLPLFPKMEMKVVPVERYVPEPERVPPAPETLAQFGESWRANVQSKVKPERMA